MNRAIHLYLAACLLIPAGASVAMAASNPTLDCNSAARDPTMDYAEWARQRDELCRPAMSTAAATVQDSKTTRAGINWENVPRWSDADITAQFIATRDKIYLYGSNNPTFARRIPWMYPDDGCYARADQVRHLVEDDAGMTPPYKLFAFGNLRVYTGNDASGKRLWGYHVVPVVRNLAGNPMVFDAALSPCRPLGWNDWLAMMVDDVTVFDKSPSLVLADPNAYVPSSMVSGELSHKDESRRNLEFSCGSNYCQYLDKEWWSVETELHRDPNVLLGSSPPWGKGVCLSLVGRQISVPSNTVGAVTAYCPTGSKVVGGGHVGNMYVRPHGSAVTKDNGWIVSGKNLGTTSNVMDAFATCLWSSSGTTSWAYKSVSIPGKKASGGEANCPSGSVVTSGGFTAPSDQTVSVYQNQKSSGNGWKVWGQNNSGSSKTLTAFATCVSGLNATVTEVTKLFTVPPGNLQSGGGSVTCPADQIAVGGGWVSTTQEIAYSSSMNPTEDGWQAFAYNTINRSQNFSSYAECLSFDTLNDNDSRIVYYGNWDYSSGRALGDYNDDVHYLTRDWDVFSYTFAGTGIDYITEKFSDQGNVDVYIDGNFQQTVDCYSPTRLTHQVVYSKRGLASGSHTIEVYKRDGTYMLLDALAIYK